MKKFLSFILLLSFFTNLFSQELDLNLNSREKTIHEKADSNMYYTRYHKNGRKYIGRLDNNPYFDPISNLRIGTGPWQGNVIILPTSIRYKIITQEILATYCKEIDWSCVYMEVYYDLNGDFQDFEIGFPADVEIPVRVIEKLENRLKKESKLKLEYNPETAKYINYIRLSKVTPYDKMQYEPIPLKTEYVKTDLNTYLIKYNNKGRKYIGNINNPYEGIGTDTSQGKIKILPSSVYGDVIAKEVFKPYHKEVDWSDIYCRMYYDLNGNFQYIEIGLPADTKIPISVIEELENRLKKESKLKLEYNSEKAKCVNYIVLG